MARPRTASEILDAETAAAWGDYLASTAQLDGPRYEEVEPWAWTRMQQRLRTIKARAAALAKPAGLKP